MDEHFFGQVTQKAIVKQNDAIVLVKERGDDKWILPGGRLNVEETPKGGLLRELREELGVDCVVEKIISVDAYHGGHNGKTPKFFVFYLVSILPNQDIVINNEIVEIALIPKKEELKNFLMPQNQKDVVEKFFDEDIWENVVDFTKIKKGGVPIDDVIGSLKRLDS